MRQRSERPRQVVSEDVLQALLGLIQRKFYEGHAVQFAKDRERLLRWVIFWPAREWFKERGVTVPNARYLEILTKVLMEAAAFQTAKVDYPPAFLQTVVQRHFAHHGDEYYAEAKSARVLSDHALSTLGKLPVKAQDDVVERFTAADRLLAATKRLAKQSVRKQPVNEQLTLLQTP